MALVLATSQVICPDSPTVIVAGARRTTSIRPGEVQAMVSATNNATTTASSTRNAVQLRPGQANRARPDSATAAANHVVGIGQEIGP